jgi:hypothetical protein
VFCFSAIIFSSSYLSNQLGKLLSQPFRPSSVGGSRSAQFCAQFYDLIVCCGFNLLRFGDDAELARSSR